MEQLQREIRLFRNITFWKISALGTKTIAAALLAKSADQLVFILLISNSK